VWLIRLDQFCHWSRFKEVAVYSDSKGLRLHLKILLNPITEFCQINVSICMLFHFLVLKWHCDVTNKKNKFKYFSESIFSWPLAIAGKDWQKTNNFTINLPLLQDLHQTGASQWVKLVVNHHSLHNCVDHPANTFLWLHSLLSLLTCHFHSLYCVWLLAFLWAPDTITVLFFWCPGTLFSLEM